MKLIHFSDPHEGGGLEHWSAFFDKRLLGSMNFRFRRKGIHRTELLEKAVSFILKEKPDAAICTGDITNCGQPGEFRRALELLRPLIDSDIKLFYVPGNHDAYVRNKKCREALKEAFKAINQNRCSLDELPLSVRIADCELVLTNSSVPTTLFSSCGHFSRDSRIFLEKLCSDHKKHPIIIAGHFPLIERHPLARFRRRLWGQAAVRKLLDSGRIDVSLCGHVHVPYFVPTVSGGRGEYCSGSVTKTGKISILKYDAEQNLFAAEERSVVD